MFSHTRTVFAKLSGDVNPPLLAPADLGVFTTLVLFVTKGRRAGGLAAASAALRGWWAGPRDGPACCLSVAAAAGDAGSNSGSIAAGGRGDRAAAAAASLRARLAAGCGPCVVLVAPRLVADVWCWAICT